jgi:hypothetical protein
MVQKRKQAPGEANDILPTGQPHRDAEPVDISRVPLPNKVLSLQKSSFDLPGVIKEMELASNHYLQLSCLQRLKARLLQHHDGFDISDEVCGVLEWLLALYLDEQSKPLRKTLIGVIAVGARILQDDDAHAKHTAMAAVRRYSSSRFDAPPFGVVVQGGGVESSVRRIATTSGEVATFLGALEVPLLADKLLDASIGGSVGDWLTFLATRFVVHLRPIQDDDTKNESHKQATLDENAKQMSLLT